jgi:hypothetical protein
LRIKNKVVRKEDGTDRVVRRGKRNKYSKKRKINDGSLCNTPTKNTEKFDQITIKNMKQY